MQLTKNMQIVFTKLSQQNTLRFDHIEYEYYTNKERLIIYWNANNVELFMRPKTLSLLLNMS